MSNYYGSLITEVINPFGRGSGYNSFPSTGAQYSALVSSAGVTYTTVEEVTIPLPINAIIKELNIGLTGGLGLTVTTDCPYVKYLIKDNAQTSYDTLLTVTSTVLAGLVSTASTAFIAGGTTTVTDQTFTVNATPSNGTYFTGKSTFQIAYQVAADAATSNARGCCKNSSFVQYSYYLVG